MPKFIHESFFEHSLEDLWKWYDLGLIVHEYNYFNDKLHGSYVEYYHDGIQSISGG